MIKDKTVRVFTSPLLYETNPSSVYPPERAREIENTKNPDLKRQRFTAFRLLQYALKSAFDTDIRTLTFTKTNKWECDRFVFSLSHSPYCVAVAVAEKEYCSCLGVDVQPIEDRLKRLYPSFCCENELKLFQKSESPLSLACTLWTRKESFFKAGEDKTFIPKKIDTTLFEKGFVSISVDEPFDTRHVLSFYSDVTEYSYRHIVLDDIL